MRIHHKIDDAQQFGLIMPRAQGADARWLEQMLNREGRELGTRVERQRDHSFELRWG